MCYKSSFVSLISKNIQRLCFGKIPLYVGLYQNSEEDLKSAGADSDTLHHLAQIYWVSV